MGRIVLLERFWQVGSSCRHPIINNFWARRGFRAVNCDPPVEGHSLDSTSFLAARDRLENVVTTLSMGAGESRLLPLPELRAVPKVTDAQRFRVFRSAVFFGLVIFG